MLYLPSAGPSEPSDIGLDDFSRRELLNPDGGPIVYWETNNNKNTPILLYFHGNYGGLYAHTRALAFLSSKHFHVVAMEYPGYPSAAGAPTQATIVANAQRVFDHFRDKNQQLPIITWGYSLGSGVATQLAASRTVNGMVLEAPFTSTADRAAELFPIFPVHLLMRDQFRSRDIIAQINTPLFIMHGENDSIIPIHHGEALFAMAHEPKTFRRYDHAGHLDLMKTTAYSDAVNFLRHAIAQPTTAMHDTLAQ